MTQSPDSHMALPMAASRGSSGVHSSLEIPTKETKAPTRHNVTKGCERMKSANREHMRLTADIKVIDYSPTRAVVVVSKNELMRNKGEVLFETLVAFVVQNHTEFSTAVEQFEQFFIISNDRNTTIQVKFNKRKTSIVEQCR